MPSYKRLMSDAEFEEIFDPAHFAKGKSRTAHFVPNDESVIVKRSISIFPGANFMEWFIWNAAAASSADSRNLLGECFSISETGRYILMERLDDINPADYPNIPKVPVWFDDPKPCAFGKSGDHIKIRDYGLVDSSKLLSTELDFPPAFAMEARFQINRKDA